MVLLALKIIGNDDATTCFSKGGRRQLGNVHNI